MKCLSISTEMNHLSLFIGLQDSLSPAIHSGGQISPSESETQQLEIAVTESLFIFIPLLNMNLLGYNHSEFFNIQVYLGSK